MNSCNPCDKNSPQKIVNSQITSISTTVNNLNTTLSILNTSINNRIDALENLIENITFPDIPADVDNYVDSVVFSPDTRVLTLGRTGTLTDLTTTIPASNFVLFTEDTVTLDLEGLGTEEFPLKGNVNISNVPNNGIQIIDDGLYTVNTIKQGVVYGGIVTWDGEYNYSVSAAGYYINGVFYTSPSRTFTLSTPDDTFNRIDTFIVDNNGLPSVLEGQPSSNPAQASLDPATQLELSLALVEVGTTEPTILTECIYVEGTEWVATPSTNRINVISTSSPCVGLKSVEATNVLSGDSVIFQKSTTVDAAADYSVLRLYLRTKARLNAGKKIVLQFKNGNTNVGNAVNINGGTFGFNDKDFLDCQQVSIPLISFGLNAGNLIDSLSITVKGNMAGFYLDEICFQGVGLPQPPVTTDNDNYVNSVSYDTDTHTLTLGRTGTLPDLTTTIPAGAAQVNSDWNATSGVAEILNKPILFSGDYNDLTNKPVIPAEYELVLTTNGTSGAATYDANTNTLNIPTITGGSSGSTVTANNALTLTGSNIQLGGDVVQNTVIDTNANKLDIKIANTTNVGIEGTVSFDSTQAVGGFLYPQLTTNFTDGSSLESSSTMSYEGTTFTANNEGSTQAYLQINGNGFETFVNDLSGGGAPQTGIYSGLGETGIYGGLLYIDILNNPTEEGYVLTSDVDGYATWQPASGGGSGATITADNGLTKTTDNIQLGGTLLHDTTIDNGEYTLHLTGTDTDFGLLHVVNTGTGSGIFSYAPSSTSITGQSVTSLGVWGASSSSTGVVAQSATGTGLTADSTNGGAGAIITTVLGGRGLEVSSEDEETALLRRFPATTRNIPITMLRLLASGGGGLPSQSGYGGTIDWWSTNTTNSNRFQGNVGIKWSNTPLQTTLNSQFDIVLSRLGNFENKLSLLSTGDLILGGYGLGNITGTLTKYLGVASNGKVIEVDAPSGGGSITADNGLHVTGSEVRLGGTLHEITDILFNNNNLRFTQGTISSTTAHSLYDFSYPSVKFIQRDSATIYTDYQQVSDGIDMDVQNGSNFTAFSMRAGYIAIQTANFRIQGIPIYANDAAADADTNLPENSFYKLTGSRAIYQKPTGI